MTKFDSRFEVFRIVLVFFKNLKGSFFLEALCEQLAERLEKEKFDIRSAVVRPEISSDLISFKF